MQLMAIAPANGWHAISRPSESTLDEKAIGDSESYTSLVNPVVESAEFALGVSVTIISEISGVTQRPHD